MRFVLPGVLIVAVGLLMACGTGPPAGSPPSAPGPSASTASSGVEGTTRVDAGCPVLHAGQTCPQRPIQARIVVTAPGRTAVVTNVTSGQDGRFRIPLAPGPYILTGQNTTGAPVPTAMPVHVRVQPDGWTQVTVDFDSGVR
jgi:hypothetical protein